MIETERKFLVKSNDYQKEAIQEYKIIQGFLNTHPDRTVRVRVKGELGFLTIKGRSNVAGTSRFEWEQEISLEEARVLLNICEPGIIEKTRYEVPSGDHLFEVDKFLGENEGLVLAEVELEEENEEFVKPSWLGEEVTGKIKYYNSQLSIKPYNLWKH